MLINKHIGFDADSKDDKGGIVPGDGQGIDGALFMQELLTLDTMGKKRIQIWINSPGGVVTDGYNIYSAILKSITPVDTVAIGACASIAGVIFQAGRKRIMADYAWLMYHDPFGGSDGILKTMKDSIIKMIEQRCGMSEDEVARMMARTSFITADEAKQLKLCDEITPSVGENTKYLKRITNYSEFHKECNLVLNSILNNNPKINTMIKVCMKLGLVDGTPEDSIVAAITDIQNKAKSAEQARDKAIQDAQDKAKSDGDELDKLKALFEKKKAAADEAEAKYNACKSELDAMTEEKKKAEDKLNEDKAKNMVEGFAKLGRIKNDATVILKWSKLAVADFDGTKAMIEELPLNKVAPVITEAEANKLEKGQLPTTALGLAVMSKLRREGKLPK
jgi:ATP-dependent Clp protease protease subunit